MIKLKIQRCGKTYTIKGKPVYFDEYIEIYNSKGNYSIVYYDEIIGWQILLTYRQHGEKGKKNMKLSKQEREYIRAYNLSNKQSIDYCYSKPSFRKMYIEECIFRDMEMLKGFGYKVLSFNKFYFTCAYQYFDADSKLYLRVETPKHTFDIPYIDLWGILWM